MSAPEVSIILPVYNVENTLRRCIDSILAQTESNFEVLLIDDGSSDSSGKICDYYCNEDNRVRVIHKDNGGVSSARNIGLKTAKGRWIVFIDSDDYVDENYIKNLVSAAKVYNCQLVQAGFKKISGDREFTINASPNIENIPISSIDLLSYLRGFAVCKLFIREIIEINGLKFEETLTLAEDLCFVLQYVNCIDRITFIPDSNYSYVEYNYSASYKLHKPQSLLKLWQLENSILNDFQKKATYISLSEWQRDISNYIFEWITSWIIHYANGPLDKNISRELEDYYEDYYSVLKNHKLKSLVKNYIAKLILNKKFRLASFLLFIISKYKQKKYNYEI